MPLLCHVVFNFDVHQLMQSGLNMMCRVYPLGNMPGFLTLLCSLLISWAEGGVDILGVTIFTMSLHLQHFIWGQVVREEEGAMWEEGDHRTGTLVVCRYLAAGNCE